MSQGRVRMLLVSVALVILGSLPVAQAPFAPPPQIPYGRPINAEIAKTAAAASIAEARKNNRTMAIAIVDTGGSLVPIPAFFTKVGKRKRRNEVAGNQ